MLLKTFIHKNFGDLPLNKYIYQKITGNEPEILSSDIISYKHNYLMSGSILNKADEKSIVWGSGFITHNSMSNTKPHRIYAVRGLLTWEQLKKNKIECPYIFGDPCLILPKFYNPIVKKIYKLGIIPHYIDKKNEILNQYRKNKDIKIIDICQDVEPFIYDILECENIASSSLHGLIASDAYKIPNIWIGLGNNIAGGGFKFFDYYSITDKNPINKYILKKGLDYHNIINYCTLTNITVDIDKFWEVCPLRRLNEPKMD